MANPTTHHVIIDITTTTATTTTTTTTTSTTSNSDASPPSVDVVSTQSSNSRLRTGDDGSSLGRVSRTPLNSAFCVSLEFVFTLCQIVASVIVLDSSRNEHPHAPLFAWIVGYASGCVVSLPLLLWRYFSRGDSESRSSATVDDASGILLSNSNRIQGGDDVGHVSSNQGSSVFRNTRINVLMEYLKIILDLFFASWFVVGNIWIFGGQSSADEAPNLYRLCVVFLTFSAIGYALPFILCLTICCCLPCIISTLGVNEDQAQTRGATSECIDALPTHKFKLNRSKSIDGNSPDVIEGGVVSRGTEKERTISGEDAVCCICIANYENNDELRELPCSHLFHKDCVDKWLKINALCPLCKRELGRNETEPVIEENASQQRAESRVENSPANTSS